MFVLAHCTFGNTTRTKSCCFFYLTTCFICGMHNFNGNNCTVKFLYCSWLGVVSVSGVLLDHKFSMNMNHVVGEENKG